jgi:UDP-2,3-diacylglucosamine pyrophosphatase LpxH
MTKKTVFISDFHLTDEASYAGQPHPYNKISTQQIQNTANFLTYIGQRPKEFERVVLLGDILDLWTVPYSLPPSSIAAVVGAKQNAPIFKVLNLLNSAGIEVVYVAGNHDDCVKGPFDTGRLKVVKEYRDGTILGYHGHENCLFNGPDPKGRNSFGYYITRVAAGVTLKTGKDFPSEAAMLIKNRDQLLKIPRQGLTTTVWNVVTDEAEMGGGDVFNGAPVPNTVDTVRSAYASLYSDRHGDADQIAAEFDPYYSMFGGNARLCICGHSHRHVFSSLSDHYMLYMNVGAWCYESESYFGVTWTDDAGVWGALYRWTNNGIRKVNAACVPK